MFFFPPRGRRAALPLLAALALSLPAAAQEAASFRFEDIVSLDAMKTTLRDAFPAGTPRATLQRALAQEGGASQRAHPRRAATEKYLYDINICDAYIWRWNISADYDAAGALLQVWVNGDPVHAAGPQKIDVASLRSNGKAAIYKGTRARPEAHKGEKQLAYMMFDADANLETQDDQLVIGGGPTRPMPGTATKLYAYSGVELWRSIFDPDPADRIHRYRGMCPAGWGG